MKLTKIDLSRIVAVGHNGVQLGLLIDRGEEIEYIEIPAPEVACDGLQYVSNFANTGIIGEAHRNPTRLRGSLPLDRCEESCFLGEQEEDEDAEPAIELECRDEDGDEYYPAEIVDGNVCEEANPCDQLLNFQVPGYSFQA